MRGVALASNSLRVGSGVMSVSVDTRGRRKATGMALTVEAIDGADVLIKSAAADCGMFPLIGEGQITDDG